MVLAPHSLLSGAGEREGLVRGLVNELVRGLLKES